MKLRVHSWGGLGSQLFALSLIFDLKKIFPKRGVILIHHTSGVSRRLFEIEKLIDSNIKLKIIDDFKFIESTNSNTKIDAILEINKCFKKAVKITLETTKIYSNFDRTKDLKEIKPWTLILRGHYSERKISEEFIKYYFKKLKNDIESTTTDSLVVHYRLGDLINLPGKSIIPPDNLIEKIRIVLKSYDFKQVTVFSDSIDEARNSLSQIDNFISNVEFSNSSTMEVMINSISAKYFIGTNSKVSMWIIKFRNQMGFSSQIIQHEHKKFEEKLRY
jgi:hypothetical protein